MKYNFILIKDIKNILVQDGDHSQAITEQCGPGCSQLKIRKRGKPSWSPNWFSVILRCNDMFAQFFHERGAIVCNYHYLTLITAFDL